MVSLPNQLQGRLAAWVDDVQEESMEVVADKVAAELAGILREVERGARLLHDGLPVY